MTRCSIRAVKITLHSTFTAALVFVAAACNPHGTCIVTSSQTGPDDLGDSCIVNTNKSACDSYSGSHEFFAEDGAQGTLRCKSAGFEGRGASSKDALFTYFKKKK